MVACFCVSVGGYHPAALGLQPHPAPSPPYARHVDTYMDSRSPHTHSNVHSHFVAFGYPRSFGYSYPIAYTITYAYPSPHDYTADHPACIYTAYPNANDRRGA